MESACCNLGLHISWTKIKVQNIGAGLPAHTIMVDGQWVEGVENFTYLGRILGMIQRRILGVHWYEHVTNIAVARRTNLPHIGALIAARRYSLFGHVVRQPADIPSNMALKICRDMSMSR